MSRAIYEEGLRKVATTPPPQGQKFLPNTFVKIAKDLGSGMSHFTSDTVAQVQYTYAHAYKGADVKSYSLLIREEGLWRSSAWYKEWQLEAITDQGAITDLQGSIDYQNSPGG